MSEIENIEEGDYIITDSGSLGSRYSISIKEKKFLKEVGSFIEAIQVIHADMKKSNFYPSVFYVDDHGGVTIILLEVLK